MLYLRRSDPVMQYPRGRLECDLAEAVRASPSNGLLCGIDERQQSLCIERRGTLLIVVEIAERVAT